MQVISDLVTQRQGLALLEELTNFGGTTMKNKLGLLKAYFSALAIDSEYISPNLVAFVVADNFPWWELSSEEIVFLSDNL